MILTIIIIIIGIPTIFFTLCVSFLCCFHMFLIVKGVTTKEKLGKNK